MSNRHTSAPGPRDQAGFTLIELLVVIIILGILASVVVFAVTGVGDKGKANAIKIDERTIRTAEEAFCAQNNRYGSGAELAEGGFLSEVPEYHRVSAQTTGGSCRGWAFSILPTSQADPNAGKWTLTDPSPLGSGALKRLRDGRVVQPTCDNFDCEGTGMAIWNPSNGKWSLGDATVAGPVFNLAARWAGSVLLTENCGLNCDKILVLLEEGWHLFDPNAASGTQWQNLGNNSYSSSSANMARLVQFRDVEGTAVNECGVNCGKVLLRSTGDQGSAELYDPKVSGPAAFTPLSYGGNANAFGMSDHLLLPDGRVLMFGAIGFGVPKAVLLDPATLTFSDAGDPLFRHSQGPSSASILPNGEILVANGASNASRVDWEIYAPEPGGPGTWSQPGSPTGCFTPPNPSRRCVSMGSLPDGRVLAASSTSPDPFASFALDKSLWLFDHMTRSWSRTADKPAADMSDTVLLDPRTGPCAEFCNKVLSTAGFPGFAPLVGALYTP